MVDEIGTRSRPSSQSPAPLPDDRDRHRSPTAFALPGGFIFIAHSLVQLCNRNEDDVAFVLAHEMAHVIRRHAIERLNPAEGRSVWSRDCRARRAGRLGRDGSRTVGIQGLASAYSQDEEFEADELGVLLMRTAQFDPAGAIRMLQCLGRFHAGGAAPPGLNRYLSTHPPIESSWNASAA